MVLCVLLEGVGPVLRHDEALHHAGRVLPPPLRSHAHPVISIGLRVLEERLYFDFYKNQSTIHAGQNLVLSEISPTPMIRIKFSKHMILK